MKQKNKTKNKSIIGIIQFMFRIMDKKDKCVFAILTCVFAFGGLLMLIPAQVTAVIVSFIAGEQASLFGIAIPSDLSLIWVVVICLLLELLSGIILNSIQYFANKFSLRIYLKAKEQAFDWATIPRKNLDLGMTIGDATYRINDSIADLEWVICSLFDTILPNIFSAVASAIYVAIMVIYALPILVVGLVATVITFLIRQKIEGPVTIEMEKNGSKLTNFLVNTLGNLTLINISKSRDLEGRNLNSRMNSYMTSSKKRYGIWRNYWITMSLITTLSTYAIILISAGSISTGAITASSIVLILSYVSKVYSPVQNFGWFLNSSTQLMSKITRLEELKPKASSTLDTTKDSYTKPIEKIELKNVCVRNDENTTIENINFTLNRGELTVVTGESGGGKTTSLRSLIGIAEKEGGEIILNDEYTPHTMYSYIDKMAVVMQSPFIFNRDVKDNIYYPDIEENRSTRATIKDFHLDKIITKKYNEENEGDMELKLSGGEKKRICVLRGLLQNKQVYIFDEPTNELDAVNTAKVVEYMQRLKKSAIVMVVTHDVRMINVADKVITINNAVRKDALSDNN